MSATTDDAAAAASSSPDASATTAAPPPSRLKVYGAAAAAQLCWSGQQVFLKVSLNSGLSPFVIVGLRALGSIALFAALAYFIDGPEKLFSPRWREDGPWLVAMGVSGILLNHNLIAVGNMLASASEAVFMQPGIAVFTAMFSIMLKHEKPSWLKFFSIAGAIGGSVVIMLANAPSVVSSASSTPAPLETSSSKSTHALGLLCFVGNCIFWSAMVIMQKPLLTRLPALTIIFWTFVAGGSINIVIACFFVSHVAWAQVPSSAWASVAFIILIGTGLSWQFNAYANMHLPPSITGMAICAQPLFGAILGLIILGERINSQHAAGGLMICASVALIIYARNQELRAAAELAPASPKSEPSPLSKPALAGVELSPPTIQGTSLSDSHHGVAILSAADVYGQIDDTSSLHGLEKQQAKPRNLSSSRPISNVVDFLVMDADGRIDISDQRIRAAGQ